MYVYKEQHKFPHLICISAPGDDPLLIECNSWLTQNIGAYREFWFCPNWRTIQKDSNVNLWPYGFKSLEDAMAFKLRWG